MSKVVALIGRPNVGKSTLFNCLTKTKDALVADEPGLTRDRQYGLSQHDGRALIIVDTGGIGVQDKDVDSLMVKQSLAASEEADLIFFLVDAKAGLTPLDAEIAKRLRQLKKPVVLVVNKIDGVDEHVALADFYKLGFKDIKSIAASHGRGVKTLLDFSMPLLGECFEAEDEDYAKRQGIAIAVIGRPNVGKSTLVNRILGEERVVAYDLPGTTRDSIFIPFEREEKTYTLIDTAGIRRRGKVKEVVEKFSVIKALKAMELSNVCLVLFDASEGIVEQDLHLIRFAIDAGKSLILLVNKWDGLSTEQKEKVKTEISRRLHFASFAPIHFISAKHGTGVGQLLPQVTEVYAAATQDLSTPQLTRILEEAVIQHPPPLVRGRRIKLRYAHAGGQNPPVIVIHGNQLKDVPESYKRFLINTYRKVLNLEGTPIRIQFKGGENPYQDKKNKLTLSQQRKRKRMLKFHKKKDK